MGSKPQDQALDAGIKFRIAGTFSDSLACLTGDEQKAVKTTAFDLQMNPASPGMQLHKLERSKDKNFWSVRVSSDLRLIVHRTEQSLLLCFVGHHDKAYDWAERRRLDVHPKTGAAQWVEIRETVKEIVVPVYKATEQPVERQKPAAPVRKASIFAGIADEELLSYGVPVEWLPDVKVATEDSLLALGDHLPAEAAEALLELATGGKPQRPQPVAAAVSPFDHPDAQRRFRGKRPVDPSGREFRRRHDRRHDEDDRRQVAGADRGPGAEWARSACVRREPRPRPGNDVLVAMPAS